MFYFIFLVAEVDFVLPIAAHFCPNNAEDVILFTLYVKQLTFVTVEQILENRTKT